ncbi:antiterminator LoaP [Eubacterium sp. MSJ-33]|uniref:antiterminator LoaP n=1 Tax=Eubacterium sp. MSJ-33 TaxID=2841528 RepID=UPI001C758DE9|nr:antiterminator LoaP [Eubacterium sp. MSJ-33]QWT52222.1 antiterminator LoaP [Eubacterium sp. MSJ-33]
MYYVIWTLTGKEDIVKDEIVAQIGHENKEKIHILTRERKQKYRGEWQIRKEKLFPGYLFMDLEASQVEPVRQALRKATEHAKVLKTGDELYPIYKQEEQLLRRLTGDTTNVAVSVGVIEGDKIIIKKGPLIGMEGMIKRIDRHKRMAVLEVELFNRVSEVKVGLEIVEKME